MESTFAQTMHFLLRLNSCCERLEPPMFQCSWGHQYCSRCLKKRGMCSSRHSLEEPKRSYLIEKLCFEIILKCTYADEGCDISGTCIVISKHEQYCPFSSKLRSLKGKTRDRAEKCETLRNQHTEHEEENPSRTMKNSQLVGKSQLEVFLTEFECPVCLGPITNIAQCVNHHPICIKCFIRVKECPICRGLKCLRLNMLLGLLIIEVKVPCQYAVNGCTVRGNNLDVNTHEKSCGFIIRSCPLIDTCKWQGLETQVLGHCRKNHLEVISSESGRRWKLKGFLSNPKRRTSCTLLHTDGVLFRCIWTKYEGEVLFAVNYLVKGGEKKPQRIYQLNIFEKNSEGVAAGGINVCSHINDDDNQYVRNNAVIFDLDLLLVYCDEDSSLTYNVKVM